MWVGAASGQSNKHNLYVGRQRVGNQSISCACVGSQNKHNLYVGSQATRRSTQKEDSTHRARAQECVCACVRMYACELANVCVRVYGYV